VEILINGVDEEQEEVVDVRARRRLRLLAVAERSLVWWFQETENVADLPADFKISDIPSQIPAGLFRLVYAFLAQPAELDALFYPRSLLQTSSRG
jgi:hypothetical protein